MQLTGKDEANTLSMFQTVLQVYPILTGESANEILSENKNEIIEIKTSL